MTATDQRVGDWIQTFTGLVMYPLDPRPEEICIEDIAHALSNLCRFTGHCSEFYSVAEHSVRVSYACDPTDALWGLLHDAPEAYLADMSRPVKRYSPFGATYQKIENALMEVIAEKFGLRPGYLAPSSVKRADTVLLMTEKRDLMHGCNKAWETPAEPLEAIIRPRYPYDARQMFLKRFRELTACQDCIEARRLAYSDATTAGFFAPYCEKHNPTANKSLPRTEPPQQPEFKQKGTSNG
jgi:5'-deoxynucleotidase YfbR-like HD superfamily hydrolase